jgi:hypothetical protein
MENKEIYAEVNKKEKPLSFFQKRKIKHDKEMAKKEIEVEVRGETFFQKRKREMEKKAKKDCVKCNKKKEKK